MGNTSMRGHHSITRDEMCVLERRIDGTLQKAFYPICYDPRAREGLRVLAENMRTREDELTAEFLAAVEPLVAGAPYEKDVELIAGHFNDVALLTYQLTGVPMDHALPQQQTAHNRWQFPDGVHLLAKHAALIRGFAVPRQAVAERWPYLEDPEYAELEWVHRQATGLRGHMLVALEEYERAFHAYAMRATEIVPGLFEWKSFCRGFSDAYGDAELDYTITPGNECMVERVDEYYWACVLEREYCTYDAMDNVVGYSHRRRGFCDTALTLEPGCDLRLLYGTNFGYGNSRYFTSTLSYRGVRAINACALIFFHGVGKVGFLEHTYSYEVDEDSFEACFDDAVRAHSEYRRLGEAGFVDKYFRKSLQDLSDLLAIVANMDTFLKITSLERFDALTSGTRNALIPDEGFARISFALSADEEMASDAVTRTILGLIRSGRAAACTGNPNVRGQLDRILGPYGTGGLQLIVKKDLVRTRIVQALAPSVVGGFDVAGLLRELIPPDDGVLTQTYEGYDLVEMRVDRALSAIGPIGRLREIAALTRFESVIDEILHTCTVIAGQALDYTSREIAPRLELIVPERDRMAAQLRSVEAEMEVALHYGGDTTRLYGQSQELRERLREADATIAELEQQRSKLQGFAQTVGSLLPPKVLPSR